MKIKREIEESLIVAWTDPSGVEHERDATPDDLARGGYVPLSAFVGPLGLLSPPTLAGALEAVEGIRQDADRWEHLESEQRSRVTSYLEERDEAVERAEKAEGLLIQRETELRLAREDGDERARDLRRYRGDRMDELGRRAEKAERELATERYEHGSTITSRDMIHNKLAQAERERDEAKAGHNAVQPRVYALEADLAETVHERDSLRAELARLTAPGEGEPTDEELRAVHGRACGGATADGDTRALCIARRALWRGGVAHERARQAKDPRMKGRTLGVMLDECEDLEALEQDAYVAPKSREGLSLARKIAKLYAEARQQPAKDRATDEELVGVMRAAVMAVPCLPPAQWEVWLDARDKAGALAVAAHVRQERCLVAQAVGMGVSLEIGPHSKGVDIHVSRPRENADGGEFFEGELVDAGRDDVPPVEVPATLARLLGEVARG